MEWIMWNPRVGRFPQPELRESIDEFPREILTESEGVKDLLIKVSNCPRCKKVGFTHTGGCTCHPTKGVFSDPKPYVPLHRADGMIFNPYFVKWFCEKSYLTHDPVRDELDLAEWRSPSIEERKQMSRSELTALWDEYKSRDLEDNEEAHEWTSEEAAKQYRELRNFKWDSYEIIFRRFGEYEG